VSRLEQFASCPFRFFVQAGLRAAERRHFEVDAREKGSFQHEILARFHEELHAAGLRWRDLTPRQARERIERIAAVMTREFREGLFAANSEREAEARRLAVLLGDFIEVAVDWMQHCAFDPARVELGFGRRDDPLPAWEIELDSGRRLSFRGKIDRVDLATGDEPEEALCLVIDYKSSSRPISPLLLEHGIQIQLPAYLVGLRALEDARAVLGVRRLRPVGMFYVNLRGHHKGGHNRAEVLAQADAARRKAYQHTGRFDASFLPRFDSRPDTSIGEQFNYRKTAAGVLHANCREPMESERFRAMLDRVAEQIREMGNRIFAGEIRVDPYRESAGCACDHCETRAICRIDPWTHVYRVLRPQIPRGKAR
jgi:ATP-dependent helicase/nuclease subunit B